MRVLSTPHRTVEQVAFSADGRRLYAVGQIPVGVSGPPPDCGIAVLDVAGGAAPAALLAGVPVHTLAVNPAGRWLYANTEEPDRARSLVAVDLAAGTVRPLGFTGSSSITVSPGGDRMVTRGTPKKRHRPMLRCWKQPPDAPPEPEWDLPFTTHPSMRDPAFSPDGGYLLVTEVNHGRDRVSIALAARDPDTGASLRRSFPFPGMKSPDRLAFVPGGGRFVVASGMTLFGYDAAAPKKKPVKATNDNRKHFTGLAVHPSGRCLATSGNDETVKVWDPASLKVTRAFTWKAGKMRSVAFSPDGLLAAAGTDTGKVVVWDVDL